MSNRLAKDASKDIVFVPLNRLKKSPKNVRKVPHTKADIKAFAASIAALGMLQYPVVEPELGPRGKPTGNYLVNAGEGRRLAQLLRVKRKEIKADEPIRCILDTEHSATEISLAENAIRSDMHPADQYEAFAKLHSWRSIRQRRWLHLFTRWHWRRSLSVARVRAWRSLPRARGFQDTHPASTKALPRSRLPSVMLHGPSVCRRSRRPCGRSSMGFRTVNVRVCWRSAFR
jgi:hypothetical protein